MKKQTLVNECEYFKFDNAAELLGYSTAELLHLAIAEKIQVSAPVVAAGEFQWPVGMAAYSFPEVGSAPMVRFFDASDRVVLASQDLSRIEAVGWTVPGAFHAPDHARKSLKTTYFSFERLISERLKFLPSYSSYDNFIASNIDVKHEDFAPSGRVGYKTISDLSNYGPTPHAAEDWRDRREADFNSLWVAVSPAVEFNKTQIEHLLVSKLEIQKILQGKEDVEGSQDKAKLEGVHEFSNPSAGVERYAKPQLEILKAAIYCKNTFPEQCTNNTAWAATIDEKSLLFWEEGHPPLKSLQVIAKLLGEAANYGSRRS